MDDSSDKTPRTTGKMRLQPQQLLCRAPRHMRLREVEPPDLEPASTSGTQPSGAQPTGGRGVRIHWHARGRRGATVVSCIANLANTNMGVGMLALPAAMANAGAVGGTLLLLLSALVAGFGSHLLAECVSTVGRPASLSSISCKALGACGTIIVDVSALIICASCAIGYMIVVGDMMPEIVEWLCGASTQRELWIFAATPVVVPLAFLRRLDSLGWASSLVVACVGVILVTVLAFALGWVPASMPASPPCDELLGLQSAANGTANCTELPSPVGERVAFQNLPRTLSSFPTFLFAFAAQINVPSIVSELHQPTRPRVARVLRGGTGLTCLAYFLVAASAYATFGSLVRADLCMIGDLELGPRLPLPARRFPCPHTQGALFVTPAALCVP